MGEVVNMDDFFFFGLNNIIIVSMLLKIS